MFKLKSNYNNFEKVARKWPPNEELQQRCGSFALPWKRKKAAQTAQIDLGETVPDAQRSKGEQNVIVRASFLRRGGVSKVFANLYESIVTFSCI